MRKIKTLYKYYKSVLIEILKALAEICFCLARLSYALTCDRHTELINHSEKLQSFATELEDNIFLDDKTRL